MSIYIISNRKVLRTRSEDGKKKFSDDGKEKALPMFRVAECEIKRNKIDYTILDDTLQTNYNDVVKSIQERKNNDKLAGSARMFYDLYTQMLDEKKSRSDVLFFIHGFSNSFQDNLEHIVKLHKLYIEPEQSPLKHLVYVSWPTRDHKVLTYWDDQQDAIETGFVLGRLYLKLLTFFRELFEIHRQEQCQNKIHLAAHSMGNQVLKQMLNCIPDLRLFPLFGEVLLLHSDVEDDVYNPGQPFTKLEKLASRTHMYVHNSDDALRISRFTKNGNKRLGHRGPVDRSFLNNKTFIVDVTQIRGGESLRERCIDHWGYLDRKEQVEDIITVLIGQDEALFKNRELRPRETNYFYLKDK